MYNCLCHFIQKVSATCLLSFQIGYWTFLEIIPWSCSVTRQNVLQLREGLSWHVAQMWSISHKKNLLEASGKDVYQIQRDGSPQRDGLFLSWPPFALVFWWLMTLKCLPRDKRTAKRWQNGRMEHLSPLWHCQTVELVQYCLPLGYVFKSPKILFLTGIPLYIPGFC